MQGLTNPEQRIENLEETLNASSAISPRSEYLRITKTLTYSYLFTIPLILLYEFGSTFINGDAGTGVRVGADVLVKRLLQFLELRGTLWVSLVVLFIGLLIMIYERKRNIPLKPGYFLLMFGESLCYAIVVGMAVSALVSELLRLQIPLLQVGRHIGLVQGLVLSLGAGVYEELVFRLILVTALFGIFHLLPIGKKGRYLLAMVVGALIFSAAHYMGSLGDTFRWDSFTFRFLMGIALNILYMTRGFGVAAMTHALFDVIVTVMQS